MSKELDLIAFSWLNKELEIPSNTMLLDLFCIHGGESVKADILWFDTCLNEQSLQSSTKSFDDDSNIVKIYHNIAVKLGVFLLFTL
jgi:hypothetical protein